MRFRDISGGCTGWNSVAIQEQRHCCTPVQTPLVKQAVAGGPTATCARACQLELGQDVTDVRSNRRLAHDQPRRDSPICVTVANQHRHLALAGTQRIAPILSGQVPLAERWPALPRSHPLPQVRAPRSVLCLPCGRQLRRLDLLMDVLLFERIWSCANLFAQGFRRSCQAQCTFRLARDRRENREPIHHKRDPVWVTRFVVEPQTAS